MRVSTVAILSALLLGYACAMIALATEPKRVIVEMDDGTTRVFVPPVKVPDVVTPIPVERPTVARLVASSGIRGTGKTFSGDLAGLYVDGYATNLVLTSTAPATVSGVVSVNAWRDEQPTGWPRKAEWGQGLYVGKIPAVTIDGSLFAYNGWQQGKPLSEKNMFRHGVYIGDDAGAATVTSCIFAFNSGCGLQVRGTGPVTVSNCVFIGNATGFLVKQKQGPVTIDNCLFIGNDWTLQTNAEGKQVWADGHGITTQSDLVVTNCLFVGRRVAVPADGRKRTAPAWLATLGRPKVNESGNRVIQWGPNGIEYDPTPALKDAIDGKVTVDQTIQRIRADVARLIPAA